METVSMSYYQLNNLMFYNHALNIEYGFNKIPVQNN